MGSCRPVVQRREDVLGAESVLQPNPPVQTLQSDFNTLLMAHNMPATKLQVHNVSTQRKGRDSSTFYNAKSTQFMYDVFGTEMEELGYGAC